MERNILYIQSNNEIAASFSEKFEESGIQLTVAPTASEALQIMAEREVALLLIDINIPDMRLRRLVEICTRDFPTVILNVCVDILDPLLLTKLVNRHGIHKIFVAPWNMDEMLDEIEESVECAQISREQKQHENMLNKEKEEFQTTLESLTLALKKQQYSYPKLNSILQLLAKDSENALEEQYPWLGDILNQMLRMHTTGTLDIDEFEKVLKNDLKKIKQYHSGFSIGEISSCLIGNIPKVKAENIRFVIWLLARCYAEYYTECEFSVFSSFVTATKAEFDVRIKGIERVELPEQIEALLKELIEPYSVSLQEEKKEDGVEYFMEFLTAYTDMQS